MQPVVLPNSHDNPTNGIYWAEKEKGGDEEKQKSALGPWDGTSVGFAHATESPLTSCIIFCISRSFYGRA